jgi:hypothetical protein
MFSKAANIFLFYRASPKTAVWYCIALLGKPLNSNSEGLCGQIFAHLVLYLAFPDKPHPASEKVKQLTDTSLKVCLSVCTMIPSDIDWLFVGSFIYQSTADMDCFVLCSLGPSICQGYNSVCFNSRGVSKTDGL